MAIITTEAGEEDLVVCSELAGAMPILTIRPSLCSFSKSISLFQKIEIFPSIFMPLKFSKKSKIFYSIYTILTVSITVLSFILPLSALLVNIPFYTLLRLNIWRLATSLFVNQGIINVKKKMTFFKI